VAAAAAAAAFHLIYVDDNLTGPIAAYPNFQTARADFRVSNNQKKMSLRFARVQAVKAHLGNVRAGDIGGGGG